MKKNLLTRRTFLRQTLAGGTSLPLLTSLIAVPAIAKTRNPSEKLNIGCVGIMNRGGANVSGVSKENIIAICDIDDNYLEAVGKRFPNAKRFFDYREMVDKMGDKLDGVTVSTADHTHAPIALAFMRRGINCYCEKPIAHTIEEVRAMVQVAEEKKLVTQTGIQIHAGENYRRVVEALKGGAIGEIKKAWLWTPAGGRRSVPPAEKEICPKNIHWEQWIGPTLWHDYHSCYLPGSWRSWWDFGSGRFGDMACHLTDLIYWAVGLAGTLSVKATGSQCIDPTIAPVFMEIDYLMKRKNSKEPFPMHWTVGNPPAILKKNGMPEWTQGMMFEGSDGMLLTDYDRNLLFPTEKFDQYKRPTRSIPSSPGHHEEWLQGIRQNNPVIPLCPLKYGALLTETAFLGNISYRVGQKEIQWDDKAMNITNVPEANAFLTKKYREGWNFLS